MQFDWDDLRFFQAVARTGSLSGAAKRLGVNHSTVSRRIAAFEEHLGVRLFARLPSGYAPTPAGMDMLESTARMESEAESLERRVLGRDSRLTGSLRVTAPDLAMIQYLPGFRAFRRDYPGIDLELVAENALTNLTKRDADVALRVADRPAEHLFGRCLGRLPVAIYGSKDWFDAQEEPLDLESASWIGWDESLGIGDLHRYLRAEHPGASVTCRVNTAELMRKAIQAGLGIGPIPCTTAAADGDLTQVLPPHPSLERKLWILIHRDLRNNSRVRCFMEFMAEYITSLAGVEPVHQSPVAAAS